MILIATPCFARQIDANTPILWNLNVVAEACRRVDGVDLRYLTDNAWLEQPRSVTDVVSQCVIKERIYEHDCDGQIYYGVQMPTRQECYKRCEKLGEELIKVNNEIAYTAEFADKTNNKSTCKNYKKTLWLDSEGVCIPKNSCMFNQYIHYCLRDNIFEWVNYYNLPKDDDRTSAGIVNAVIKERFNLNCKVQEQEIYEEYGWVYVPCLGVDNRMLRFDKNSNYSVVLLIEGIWE